MIGELPADFLRAETSVSQVQENAQVGRILQAQQQAGVQFVTSSNYLGALSICVVQVCITLRITYSPCNLSHGLWGYHSGSTSNQSKSPLSVFSTTYQCGNAMYCPLFNFIISFFVCVFLFFFHPQLFPGGLTKWHGKGEDNIWKTRSCQFKKPVALSRHENHC